MRWRRLGWAGIEREAGGETLVIEIEGPEVTPVLPAAVEVAAYRIATEAVTNVVQHAGASRCVVSLSMNGALEVAVSDNGTRPWDPTRIGVGWASMRERAAELGGTCTVARRSEGGTLVRAVLPLTTSIRVGDRADATVPAP